METIELNGKKYVEISEFEKLKEDYDVLRNSPRKGPNLNLLQKEIPVDPCCIIGISTAELGGDWFSTKYSLAYIKKAIKALDALDIENVDVICAKDYPIYFGRLEKDSGKVTGIVIAPRVENQ